VKSPSWNSTLISAALVFSAPEHDEWFVYLHRDGSLSQPAKGNMFKGPFHLPRALWYGARELA